jgi:photosystem II stability/assembly factor-like uncharacterized protein
VASLFISYSRRDIEFARRITQAFKNQKLDFWIDWEGIPPTVDWWKEIQKGIEEADIFLFLLSPDSAKSNICRKEIGHAIANGKRLIPVVIRDVKAEEAPPELQPLNWIFLRGSDVFADGFDKLMTAVKTDYEWVQTHRQLQVKALEWDRSSRENSFLLRGKELRDAESQLAANSQKEPYPTDLQRGYVTHSRKAAVRLRRIVTSVSLITITIIVWLIYTPVKLWLMTPEGSGWQPTNTFTEQTGITSKKIILSLDPKDPNVVFALDPEGTGIYQTTDGGSNWHPLAGESILNRRAESVASLDRLVYVITDNKILMSPDNGATWVEKVAPSQARDEIPVEIALNLYSKDEVYVGTSIGNIYLSKDKAESWIKLSRVGMNGDEIRSIAVNSELLLVVTENGLWEYSRDRLNWKEISLRECLESGAQNTEILAVVIPRSIYGPSETDFTVSVMNFGLCNSDTLGDYPSLTYPDQPSKTIYSIAIAGDLNALESQVYVSTESGMYCGRVWHANEREWWLKKINSLAGKNLFFLPCSSNVNS